MRVLFSNRSALLQRLFRKYDFIHLRDGRSIIKDGVSSGSTRMSKDAYSQMQNVLSRKQDVAFFQDLDNPEGPLTMFVHGSPNGTVQVQNGLYKPGDLVNAWSKSNPALQRDIDVISCFSGTQGNFTTDLGKVVKPKYDFKSPILTQSLPLSDGSYKVRFITGEDFNAYTAGKYSYGYGFNSEYFGASRGINLGDLLSKKSISSSLKSRRLSTKQI